jgi:hypothetical protein
MIFLFEARQLFFNLALVPLSAAIFFALRSFYRKINSGKKGFPLQSGLWFERQNIYQAFIVQGV